MFTAKITAQNMMFGNAISTMIAKSLIVFNLDE